MPEELQKKAFSIKLSRDHTFLACYPHPKFPTISITGDKCALNCKHCGGHYLQNMLACLTPDILHKTCLELASNGVHGVLLSGGYNEDGYVPLAPFLDTIERLKNDTGLFLSAHTGLVPNWLARELGRAGVDLADFDLIGDDKTIKLVLGIDRTVEDYRTAMKALRRSLPHVVPHICIGLHAGELRGEFRALDIASEIKPSTIVLLVLTPTTGTDFAPLTAPPPEVVEKVVAEARLKFPTAQLALGCMRPRGPHRVEIELAALRAGVDRMELPSRETTEAARDMGLKIKRLDACCAVPIEVVEKWSRGK